ncbi:hypothetical protein D3Y57_02125 (plasmid) [Sphingomonas paeninsulae]|uniref:Capsule biosynthesis protein n=1 Tax=Sphingomonas paeninsulae TaxID=2319844 RepID=A0A494T7M4_SPHPE|nr:DUF6356 family protein [Sphingomonas paeninsulae]AYJ84890.1 hypothetical protein D3Y57_02125 [Sphingomonas paeninsulae]
MLKRYFKDHLHSVDESYGEHMKHALGFAFAMFLGGTACLIHAFLPFLFETTGSGRVRMLHDSMIANRHRTLHEPLDAAPSAAE